ncbi:hypothetical protein LINPERHAP1_LOCUS8087 [Linum perenne]
MPVSTFVAFLFRRLVPVPIPLLCAAALLLLMYLQALSALRSEISFGFQVILFAMPVAVPPFGLEVSFIPDRVVSIVVSHFWVMAIPNALLGSDSPLTHDRLMLFPNLILGKSSSLRWNSGWIKINVDASTGSRSLGGVVSLVARDSEGQILETRARVFPGQSDVTSLEVLGFREAVSWARAKCLDFVIFEGDSHEFMLIWVKIIGMPFACRTIAIGRKLLEPIGEVVHMGYFDAHKPEGCYVKGRVRMDLFSSFLGTAPATDDNGTSFKVFFQYEGVPCICYLCGLLGHVMGDCPRTDLVFDPLIRDYWICGVTDLDEEETEGPGFQKMVPVHQQARRGRGGLPPSVAAGLSSNLHRNGPKNVVCVIGDVVVVMGTKGLKLFLLFLLLAGVSKPLAHPQGPIDLVQFQWVMLLGRA